MIRAFPKFYDDELLYSLLARYYVKSGYIIYRQAAEDLFAKPNVTPDIYFMNRYTDEAVEKITEQIPIEQIIEKHTMFPFYGRFLPYERRNRAFKAMLEMSGKHNNLLAIPKYKKERWLRYCPLCTHEDRKKYGESYWHRIHQMQGIDICPIHSCCLKDSEVIISGKVSPSLFTAEESAIDNNIEICENKVEIKLAKYVASLFCEAVDLESKISVGDFLHSRMSGTKYRSVRGESRNITLLQKDFSVYYEQLKGNSFTESWQLQKVFTNGKINTIEICMLAMFLNVPVSDLANMTLPDKTQEQLFDEEIFRLREQGLTYPEIAKRLNASINIVKSIGEKRYGTYHKVKEQAKKCGVKVKDWSSIDKDLFPKVKQVIKELQGNGIDRPKRITEFAVEKMLGLPSRQLEMLPICRAEISANAETQEEYWAKELVWAVNTIMREGQPLNFRHIRNLTNMRRSYCEACIPYLDKYGEEELAEKIRLLFI